MDKTVISPLYYTVCGTFMVFNIKCLNNFPFHAMDVFNDSYETNLLPVSQRISVFTLIFKKEDDQDLTNYRPISLTIADYRIMAFVLAARLQLVIGSITNHDQTAYIRKRYIGNNIRLVDDIIDHFDRLQKGGLLFMTNFQKAFDSLDWNFMFQALDYFKFGPSFKCWIRILYTLPVARVKNNGHLSDEFPVSRGVRQGCCVSAWLFLLLIGMFALRMRQDLELKGYDFGFQLKAIKIM